MKKPKGFTSVPGSVVVAVSIHISNPAAADGAVLTSFT